MIDPPADRLDAIQPFQRDIVEQVNQWLSETRNSEGSIAYRNARILVSDLVQQVRDLREQNRILIGDYDYARGELSSITDLVGNRDEVGTYQQVEGAINELRQQVEQAEAEIKTLNSHISCLIADDRTLRLRVEQAEAALTAKEAERVDLHRRNGWLRDEIDRLRGGATVVSVKSS